MENWNIESKISLTNMHFFVLEQPGLEKIIRQRKYIFDDLGGGNWIKFYLYYIPRSPKELDLEIPWTK